MPPDPSVDVTLDGADAAVVLDRVHDALARLWREAGDVSEADRIAVETALVEVAGNVVRHGPDARWHGRGVRVSVGPEVVVAVADQAGAPPDVDLDPVMAGPDAESGRGLAIARALAELDCAAVGGGTRWTLTRHRTR